MRDTPADPVDPELVDPTDALADLTLALCAIPSVTGDEAACAGWIEARLRACPGWSVERVGLTVAARGPSRPGRPLVLLAGHTDTVPLKSADGRIVRGDQPDDQAGDRAGDRFDPAPWREGDRIYGLGSSDMKVGLALMLRLAERLDLDQAAFDVGLIFYDREEGPWRDSGLGPALEQIPWLRSAALAFCLEPSDNVVQVGCVGSLHASLVFTGRAAHSARPWQGLNAIHAAGPLLSALAARAPVEVECGGHRFREVLSATLASGGTGRNVVPDRLTLNLNYRFAPGKPLDQAQEDVRSFVAQNVQGAAYTLEFTDLSPSGRVVTDNPILQQFLAATGASVTAKQAWTDVARLGLAGIDAVNLGPGISAQAHQAGEYASAKLLSEGYRAFELFLRGATLSA